MNSNEHFKRRSNRQVFGLAILFISLACLVWVLFCVKISFSSEVPIGRFETFLESYAADSNIKIVEKRSVEPSYKRLPFWLKFRKNISRHETRSGSINEDMSGYQYVLMSENKSIDLMTYTVGGKTWFVEIDVKQEAARGLANDWENGINRAFPNLIVKIN